MSNDPVNKPKHYAQGDIECIEAMASMLGPEAFKGYLHGNALKYLWRCFYKGNTTQDLDKALWYITKLRNAVQSDEIAPKPEETSLQLWPPANELPSTHPFTPKPWLQKPETD